MSKGLFTDKLDFEEEMASELAGPIGKKIKKKLKKAVGAVVTGGASLAIKGIKKKVSKSKVGKAAKKVVSTAKSLVAKSKASTPVKKLSAKSSPKAPAAAKKIIKKVAAKTAGDCSCKDDMAKLVAAKLVSQLGPPLDSANKILAKMELQRQATYEHNILMRDHEFRRRVLEHIATKARGGNRSCQRTLSFLRG